MFDDLRNIYKEKKGFIVATGPSLQVSDLDYLKDEITFSCNKIFLAFNETRWRPTVYSIIDRLVAEELSSQVDEIDTLKIFSGVTKPFMEERKNIRWLRDLPSPITDGIRQSRFSTNISEGTYGGYSVVYTLMQIAYHMGITKLYLIGLDFNFVRSRETGMKTQADEAILVQQDEQNHFHPEYRQKNAQWTEPRMDIMYDAFACAKQAFETDGRMIYNASRFSALDLFPRIDFDTLFSGDSSCNQPHP